MGSNVRTLVVVQGAKPLGTTLYLIFFFSSFFPFAELEAYSLNISLFFSFAVSLYPKKHIKQSTSAPGYPLSKTIYLLRTAFLCVKDR